MEKLVRPRQPVPGGPTDRNARISYLRMRTNLFLELRPTTPSQKTLLDLMAHTTWRWKETAKEHATNQAMFAGSPEEVKEKKRLEKQLDTLARTLVKCTTEMTNIRRVNLLEAQRKK